MKKSDIDLFELNEAFASVVLRYIQAFDIDNAKINVNGGVDVEGLDVAQHHGSKRLVQFEQIDVRFLHAGAFEQLFGHVDRTGQHHRRFGADIGEGADFCTRL